MLDVRGIVLEATDNTAPAIAPGAGPNLWTATSGWVRGTWPLTWQASDDSGVCDMVVRVGSEAIQGPQDTSPNQHRWTQCPSPETISDQINTAQAPDGPVSLGLKAVDAASPANVSSPSATINVDNQPVSLSLSGPTDARVTAGTQYIVATATAGPSGVAGISCSIDGSPAQWFDGSSARIPVQGLGSHQVTCTARNRALGPDGTPAGSPPQTWNMTIREPTVSSVAFLNVVNQLRCIHRRERVTIPGRWTTLHYKGKPVRVFVPAERRTVTIVQCHPQIVTRRIRVRGRWRVIRTVALPHLVNVQSGRVNHGQPVIVSGWLGTAAGTALAHQVVQVFTAPDDGGQHYRLAETVTTSANGSWTARLAPGPSRLVQAIYGGSTTAEPALAVPAHLAVPAQVALRVSPARTRWGSTIKISGSLTGGNVPPAGELVVLWIGWSGGKTEIGHVYAGPSGRFSARYTFLRGNGRERYRIWAESARESDYPFAPSSSRSVTVQVGP